ncbi:MAG: BamA/TamA family outer membrane protein [Sphingobacteriaceae bacterium]
MKAYTKRKHYLFTFLSILLVLVISGCSLTRRLNENQSLVRSITVKGIDDEYVETAKSYVDKQQQPNSRVNLEFYYLFSKNGKKDIGEPPAILDSNLVEYSRMQMEKFFQNKGFLTAKVASYIEVKKKEAELIFTVTSGPIFRIRNSTDSIADPELSELYNKNIRSRERLAPGKRFDTDSLALEREQIYQLMKTNGYYDFYRQYVNFTVDTALNSALVDVKMIVDNPEGKSAHIKYRLNNTLITISNSSGRYVGKADTVRVDSQFRFVDFSKKFRPKAVTIYVFQKKGELYDLNKQMLTTSRLSELNVFRNVPNPSYIKLPDSSNRLDTKIEIVPLKQMSDRVEGEFLFNNGRYGFNVGNTFTNRNLFKRAEILEFKINYSVLFDNARNSAYGNGIQNQDFKTGVNLIYPRILAPFNLPVLGKYGVPHTTFSSNFQNYFQKGLVSRQSFINSLTYDFRETAHKLHSLTPINIEFSQGTIDPVALDELRSQNRESYIRLIGRTVFTSGSQYSYQLNADLLNTYQNFTYFRGSIDMGGNSLSLISRLLNTRRDELNHRTLFGQIFAQYAKAEVDYRLYKSLGGEKQIVLRLNPGIGIPYGNSDQLIFEKNFYVGGASDIRAWLPRTLGPGQFNREVYSNDTTRARLKYLDQFGEIKFVGNLEYRYKLLNNFFGSKLKGGTFVDFGNVWRLKQEADNPRGEFKFNTLGQSIAMGIGTGFRLDVNFFVFRFDAGIKLKDPQFSGSDQWVLFNHLGELFRTGPFKAAYIETNGEKYRFMQLNFGIGMPF